MPRESRTRSVIIFDNAPATLTFHEWGSFRRTELDDEWHRSEIRAACGKLLSAMEWRDLPGGPPWNETRFSAQTPYFTLRLDHAEQVGELCLRCAKATP